MKLPKISSYYPYSSSNYGANSLRVDFDNLSLFFSYETVIAFQEYGHLPVVRKNDWSNTTGKHINAIEPDKSKRLNGDEFESKLIEVLKKYKLSQE